MVDKTLHQHGDGTSGAPLDLEGLLLTYGTRPWVVVDDRDRVTYVHGPVAPYIGLSPGAASADVLAMVGADLAGEMRRGLEEARASGAPVNQATFDVIPLPGTGLLVVFKERAREPSGTGADPTVQLARDLADTQELLRRTTEQHLAAMREIVNVNEDLTTRTQELEETARRLGRAQEELRAVNQELLNVNHHLGSLTRDSEQLADDMGHLLASIDIAMVFVDRARRVQRFTPRAQELLQLITGDIGRPIADLRPAVTIHDLDGAIVRVIATGAPSCEDVADHRGRHFRLEIRPYRTPLESPGAIVTFIDVTHLRRSLDEASAARDFATAILEATPIPLVVVDSRLCVRAANPAFAGMFPDRADEGTPLVVTGDTTWNPPDLAQRLGRTLAGEIEVTDLEVEHDGRTLLVSARRFDDGAVGLLAIGLLDVTARKQLEAAWAREHVIRLRSSFLDALSHELRTPLNAILLWARVLRQHPLDDARRARGVETIERSARAEAQLVDDLLEVSLATRPNAALSVEPRSIDPRPVVRAALDVVEGEAAARGVTIETAFDEDATCVNADPRRLEQITWHLACNAIKFTPEGGTVAVSLSRVDHELELRVRDSGKGIPASFLPHVFEAFAQEDVSITRPHDGLGIGLALVHHLVERQGGRITVHSDGRDAGATFTVRLPAG